MNKIAMGIVLLVTFAAGAVEKYKEDWGDLDRYPQAEWLNQSKFGLYWHWNYNSVAGIDGWYGQRMYDAPRGIAYQHHKAKYGDPSKFGYKDFAPLFTGEKFSAKQWVEDSERIGAKFVVGMAVHHDGFDMYDSSYTLWNSVDKPPHIDVMGELAREARKRGLKFGATSHLAWNWGFFSEKMYPDKFDAAEAPELYNLHDPEKGPSQAFVDEWYNRTAELIDNYKLDFLWFDFGTQHPAFSTSATKKLTAHFYNRSLEWNKTVALATKKGFGNSKSMVFDIEHGKCGDIRYPQWMADCTLNKGWFDLGEDMDSSPLKEGYEPFNQTGEYWLYQLIDIVSKNGTLLLNLGPNADGSWREEWRQELFKMGDWLTLNGEAIYGTKPWHRYGEGPTHDGTGEHYELGDNLTRDDVRFTRKGDSLYAIIGGWREGALAIKSLGRKEIPGLKISALSMIGSDEPIQWTQGMDALSVVFPKVKPCEYAYVFKLEGEGLFPERETEYVRMYIPVNLRATVSHVRLSVPGKERQLALAEFLAIGRPMPGLNGNLLLNGSVKVSSELEGYGMQKAVDGNYNGHPNMNSVFKSAVENNPWIEVELTRPARKMIALEIFGALEDGGDVAKYGIVECFDAKGNVLFNGKISELAVEESHDSEYVGTSGQ